MNQAYVEQNIPATDWPTDLTPMSASLFDQPLPNPVSAVAARRMGQYESQMVEFFQEHEGQLHLLRREYVFDPADGVRLFLRDHRALPEILVEAAIELRRCFGNGVVLLLQVLEDEGAPVTIYGIVLWKDSLDSARAALQNFDETWWISTSRRASGSIVFDYQLA
jgi:hypothetical protein